MQRNKHGLSWLLTLFGGVFSQGGIAADAPIGQALYAAGAQQSFKGPDAYFTGDVQVDMLFPDNETAHYSGAYVTFQPGARTAWHLHPAGQHMIVTSGVASRFRHVMGDQYAALVGGPSQHCRIIGSSKAHVLHSDDVYATDAA